MEQTTHGSTSWRDHADLGDRLLTEGHEVSAVDNLVTGKRANLPAAATFYKVDLRDGILGDVFAQVRPEAVFHLAAHIDVTRSVRDPAYDASINILGSLNLLEPVFHME